MMTTPSVDFVTKPDPFLECSSPPDTLIDSDGQYQPGWYPHFRDVPNVKSSMAPSRRLQYWFHLHAETATHYFSANLAQLGLVGNVSLLTICKSDGNIQHHSRKNWLWANRIRQTGGCALIWDRNSGSTVTQDHAGRIQFRFQTQEVTWVGEARPALGPPFVQSTPSPKGFGSLQWWGPIHLWESHLRTKEGVIDLPSGTLGGFDRTIGHRHRRQYWNWLSTQGHATGPEGTTTPFALQIAVDNLRPPNAPNPKKFNVWLHNRLHKFEAAEFQKGPQWRIKAHGQRSAQSLDLQFTPRWTRAEKNGHPSLFGGHFQQFFGPIQGTLCVENQRYVIDEPFALVEDSRLSL